METYKIGNKISGVIRSYTAGTIGGINMQYANQPYTTFEGAEATFMFADFERNARQGNNQIQMYYDLSYLQEVQINNVPLTNKIFNLIFHESEEKLCTISEHYSSDENGVVYLNRNEKTWYQVFIYDEDGMLETAYGSLEKDSLTLQKKSADYLIVYSYEGTTAYSFKSLDNLYITVDFTIVGNEDDNTHPMYVHLEKCGLKLNKNLYFNRSGNSIDLVLKVIQDGTSYITIK